MGKKTEFKLGNLYAINGGPLRCHFICLISINGSCLRFVDTLTGQVYDIDHKNVVNALKHVVFDPNHLRLKDVKFTPGPDTLTFLDFVDTLPKDVFDCLLANIDVDNHKPLILL